MSRFLIDEDLPRPLAVALRAVGHDAVHIRDTGRGGASDDDVFALAVREERVLVTADLDFSDVRRFTLGSHAGITIARFPNDWTVDEIVTAVMAALEVLGDEDLQGALVIIEPTRIRVRR